MWARERDPCGLHSDGRRPCGFGQDIHVIYIIMCSDHVDVGERSV